MFDLSSDAARTRPTMLNLHYTQTFQSCLTGAAEAAPASTIMREPWSGRRVFADTKALATSPMR